MGVRRDRSGQNRARIVSEAARLFVEQGLPDFQSAKRKALASLRLRPDLPLPPDHAVEAAVGEYLRLFRSASQPVELDALRCTSLRLMDRLKTFSPKLVGPVLSGLADRESVIGLHLRAEPPEAVQWFLMERRIRFEVGETRMALAGGGWDRLPSYRFSYQEAAVELVVFDARQWRHTPLESVDGRPLARAGQADLEAIMGRDSQPEHGRGGDAGG